MGYLKTFTKNLASLLKNAGKNQKELAEKLEIATPVFNRYATGERRIPLETLKQASTLLETTPEALFGCESEELEKIYSIPDSEWRDAERGIKKICALKLKNNPLVDLLKESLSKEEIDLLYQNAHPEKFVQVEKSDLEHYTKSNYDFPWAPLTKNLHISQDSIKALNALNIEPIYSSYEDIMSDPNEFSLAKLHLKDPFENMSDSDKIQMAINLGIQNTESYKRIQESFKTSIEDLKVKLDTYIKNYHPTNEKEAPK